MALPPLVSRLGGVCCNLHALPVCDTHRRHTGKQSFPKKNITSLRTGELDWTNIFKDISSKAAAELSHDQIGHNLIRLSTFVPGFSVYSAPISVQVCILYAGT
jgi:hypothetical protein